jgi:hypothetical protein
MSKKQQLGVNRDMIRYLYGDQSEKLFSPDKKDISEDKAVYKKSMTRILVWPNITYKVEELEKDSYVQTIYRMISELSKHRDDLWWELVLPRVGRPFTMFDEFDNVDIAKIAWPRYIQSTRGHFDKFSLNHSFVEIDNRFKDDEGVYPKNYTSKDYGVERIKEVGFDEAQELKYEGIRTKAARDRNRKLGRTLEKNSKDDIQWEYYEAEVNWNFKDIDLIFSHLPETTWNLLNYLGNEWHHIPPVLGYSHWFDFKDTCNWQYPAFQRECEGINLMQKCYVNTESQKKLVLKEAREIYKDSIVNKLDEKIEAFHLPVLNKQVVNEIDKDSFKTIVFNHRTKTYKDFKNFILKICDPLWEKRQDFKVWIPLLDLSTMAEFGNLSWKERDEQNGGYIIGKDSNTLGQTEARKKELYLKRLRTCRVGFSPKQNYSGWSVATTDGMMTGCPFIMFDADYYHELNPTADFFGSYEEAIDLLEKYLDDNDYRNKKAEDALKECRKSLLWSDKKNVGRLSDDIDKVVNSVVPAKTYKDGYKKVIGRIKERQEEFVVCTKKKLIRQMWGNGIKFAPYRIALRQDKNIREKYGRISSYVWKTEEEWAEYDKKLKKDENKSK